MFPCELSPVLQLRGLTKSYGDQLALDHVDLDLAAGEICGLLGPNGAGKTTLVSIVAGLRRPDSGTVHINDVDAAAEPARARRSVGLAPQELGIYPGLTPRQGLTFFGELADLRTAALRARIGEVAEALELTDLLDRKAATLSGGEKRRLHTAMAMLHRPKLLLLDEPTTGVDVHTRGRLLAAVRSLAENDGSAICYSTHYLPEVEALGASVAIIERGRIIARGSLPELIAAHGASAVELAFSGPVPDLRIELPHDIVDDTLRVRCPDPTAELAELVAAMGPAVAGLRSVEIVQPSLEGVFLQLTGRRFRDEHDAGGPDMVDLGGATPEVSDVVAS